MYAQFIVYNSTGADGHVAQFAVESLPAINLNHRVISFLALNDRDVVIWR